MGAIARAGNLDAHGLAPATDLPAEGIGTVTAATHHNIISSVPVIGMHAQPVRRCCGGPLPIRDRYEVQASVDGCSCCLGGAELPRPPPFLSESRLRFFHPPI